MRRFATAAGRLPRWKWLVVAGLVAGGLALAFEGSRRSAPPTLVNRGFKDANLSNAKTEEEVVALLGPPGDFSAAKPDGYIGGATSGPPPKGRSVEWTDDHAKVVVYFTPNGHLERWNIFRPVILPPERSWLERLRDLLD